MVKKAENKSDLIDSLKEELIKDLYHEYQKIQKEVRTHIKRENDLYVAELKLIGIPPKIQMFDKTAKREDYYKVKKIFHDVKKEIDEIMYNESINEKKITKINEEIQDLKEEISRIE